MEQDQSTKLERLIQQFEPEAEKLMSLSGIPKRYLKAKLADFKEDVLKGIDFEKGLVLVGDIETGKTHLMAAICRYHLIRGRKCVWIDAVSWLDLARESLRQGLNPYRSLIVAPYVFIDDLGTEKLTDFVYETWFKIIQGRYNEMLPTYATMNNVDALDKRIFRKLCSKGSGNQLFTFSKK